MLVHAQQGDTVDALCYRHLGSTAGLVEQTYQINPGLADLGPVLPMGTALNLPDVTDDTAPTDTTIQLWD